MKLDILAFGAHPDDIELACSGTILKHIAQGCKVGVVDLTQGELGSRGSAELRLVEAQNAGKILGLTARENLDLGDGFFEENEQSLLKVITAIRKYQPDVVFCNSKSDRHPDHGRGGDLVSRACFLAGLVKIETGTDGISQDKWRPKAVYRYVQDRYLKPDFIVDITPHFNQKLDAIKAFSSQFYDPNSNEPTTPISSKEFWLFLEARAREFGRTINTEYGEGFTVERALGVNNVLDLE